LSLDHSVTVFLWFRYRIHYIESARRAESPY
jgi:hypothetical protein